MPKKIISPAKAVADERAYLLRQAIDFIAYNDEPNELDVRVIEGTLTVVCIADTFGMSARGVAAKVRKERLRANSMKSAK